MIHINPISGVVFFSGLISVAIGIYAWWHRSTKGARVFAYTMFSLSLYIIAYSLELSSTNLNEILVWNRIEYLGILTFPTLMLIFDIQYTDHEKWLTLSNILQLFFLPTLLFIFKVFDSQLHLIYQWPHIDPNDIIPLLAFTPGPLYYVIVAYNLIVVTIGNYLLLSKSQHASTLFRAQINIILCTAVIIYLVYIYYLTGIPIFPGLTHLDLSPIVFILWGIAIAYAIFRYRLFDIAPIAREALIEVLNEGVIVLDLQLQIVDTNPETRKIFGWGSSPLGTSIVGFLENRIDPQVINALQDSINLETYFVRDNLYTYYELTITSLKNKRGVKIGYLMVLQDISKRKEFERKLQELSLQDDLTNLANRRGFKVMATQLINMAFRMHLNAALVYIDLDRLKWINDNLGHVAGDQALIATGYILKNTFRSSDIIARFGGDEFIILALESADNTVENMISRLQLQLEEHNSVEVYPYPLSFSYGIARYHWENPKTIEALLDEADRAMYDQKQAKKI